MASGSSSSTTLPTRMASGTNLPTFIGTNNELHVVIFPYMAQSHTIPMLDLAKCLSRRHAKVTIITTPANMPFITSHTSGFPAIGTAVIPFPEVPYLPRGCENMSALPSADYIVPFLNATKLLNQPFEDLLRRMKESRNPPVCVISDYFLGWTSESCDLLGIPRIVSHGMGALPMLIIKCINLMIRDKHEVISSVSSPDEMIEKTVAYLRVPFQVHKRDFPEALWADDDLESNDLLRNLLEFDEADMFSWGMIVNSFEELERFYIPALETIIVGKRDRAWLVGPLFLGNNTSNERSNDPCIKWLDKRCVDKDSAGAIYVSFGSQDYLDNDQMNEIAYGLLMAGEPFIWVIRSGNWTPPSGWEESVGSLGLVIREWVNQRIILEHPGIGGFLSHCGWNSILEGLTAGVPLLAWPMDADQPINATYIVEKFGMGIKMPRGNSDTKIVDRFTIFVAIKELMRGDKGANARMNVEKYGKLAKTAMADGGSSHRNLDQLVETLFKLSIRGI